MKDISSLVSSCPKFFSRPEDIFFIVPFAFRMPGCKMDNYLLTASMSFINLGMQTG